MALRRLLALPRAMVREGRVRWLAARQAHTTMTAMVAPPPRAFGSWGAGSFIAPPARIESPECVHIGDAVIAHEHLWIAVPVHPGRPAPELHIGSGTRISRFVKIECAGSVTLGEGVLIADRVLLSDVDHPAVTTDEGPATDLNPTPRPIVIGDRVFIGAGAVIKSGVTIGEHAYVSANTVVVRDVPPRTLVAGSPARAVRQWEAE